MDIKYIIIIAVVVAIGVVLKLVLNAKQEKLVGDGLKAVATNFWEDFSPIAVELIKTAALDSSLTGEQKMASVKAKLLESVPALAKATLTDDELQTELQKLYVEYKKTKEVDELE